MMKKILYFVGLSLMMASCGKFLEPKSQNEYVPKNTQALSEMLLGSAYIGVKDKNFFTYNDIFSDDIEMSKDFLVVDPNYTSRFKEFKYIYSWHPEMEENGSFSNCWTAFYTKILGCNAALDLVDGVIGTDSEKAIIKIEALTLRAFFYFHLVNLYGEPYSYDKKGYGVPLKLESELNQTQMKRSSVEEVYGQIITDLITAENLYGTLKESKYAKSFRVTLPVIYNMLAKAYLFSENWGKAAEYSKMLIDNKLGITLYDLNSFRPLPDTKPYVNFCDLVNKESYWMYGCVHEGVTYMKLFSLDDYMGGNPGSGPKVARSVCEVSKSLVDSYEEDDLRKFYYLVTVWNSNDNIEYAGKYQPFSKMNISAIHAPVDGVKDFGYSMRLSEAYLMYAEAKYRMGGAENETESLGALNTLRKARIKKTNYTAIQNLTSDALFELIQKERRRELCFEASRFYDLRRWGVSFTRDFVESGRVTNTFTMEKNDAAYLVPIAREVKDAGLKELNRTTSPKW